MTVRLILSLRQIGCDRRGTSILELGLSLPLLMTVLVCLLDISRCYSAQMSLQQSAARALERVQVGSDRLSFAYARAEAATAAGVDPSQVTVTSWTECNNNTTRLAYTSLCTVGQTSARYVEVTINSAYTPYFSFTPLGTRRDDGKVAISARSAVRVQ